MVTALLATVAVALFLLFFRERRNLLWVGIVSYMFIVLYTTQFSRITTEDGRGINLLPFHFLYWVKIYLSRGNIHGVFRCIRGLYLNILMFIPFGFLAKTWKPAAPAWKIVLAGFGFSMLIELTQMIFHLGMFETDDLMTNTLGTWLGTAIYGKRMQKI